MANKLIFGGKGLLIGAEKNFTIPDGVKVLGSPTTGVDHIPEEECLLRGIKIITLRGERDFLDKITSTAEHTFGLIISLLRKYKVALREPYQQRDFYTGTKIAGKTLGIIGGEGRIASQMERMAKCFGMKVIACDKGEKIEPILSLSDIVSLHIPLEGNECFFTSRYFSMMKKDSYFINTSRNGILAPGSLLNALEKKLIVGAAVDFIDDEDLRAYASRYDNLILTNHIGGRTIEDAKLTEDFIIEKMKQYLCLN